MNSFRSISFHHNPHDRIRSNSPKILNKKIDQRTESLLQQTINDGPIAIHQRLNALDREWDIDRAIILFFSGMALLQLAMMANKNSKKQFWAPLLQAPFLFLYASLGWSPPVPLLRKLGFRTRFEIEEEREILLKALYEEDWKEQQKDETIDEWDIYGSI
ncbi:MAG: hypothetical protein ACXVLQ_05175 [Bacteriovorax sp.]